jgi:diketogulonate reductase-like aldo/keto reductase
MPKQIRTRPFGPASDQVTVLGQGTWNMERDDRRQAIAALQAGLDIGMTHIDTAELYGSGKVEELVAEALAGRRDELYLVSKVLPQNASRRGTLAACEASLRRLRTDRLDCYLLHWKGSHPLADTVAAFEELQAAGKIRSWGVSNFDEDDLARTIDIAGEGRIACNQVLYHLGERTIEHAVIPFCEEHGIAVVAYSPFGSGDFPDPRSAGGRTLAEVAEAHGATPHQVALAFLTRRPALFAIPKTAKPERARENAAAAELVLTEDEIARIDQAFPVGKRRRGVATL